MSSKDLQLQSTTGILSRAFEFYATMPSFRALVAAIPTLGGVFDAYATAEAAKVAAERHEQFESWIRELADCHDRQLSYLRERISNLEERVSEQASDPQYSRILGVYAFEAAREPLDERLSMLAAACAGNLDPRLTIAEKARAERTIRELNPEDVLSLWGISRSEGLIDLSGKKHHSTAALRWSVYREIDAEVLVGSGCIRVEPNVGFGGGEPEVYVTKLGRNVLSVLRVYTESRDVPFEIPGRQRRSGDRTVEDAELALEKIPPIHAMISYAKRAERVGAQYQMPEDSNPSRGTLFINLFDDEGKALGAEVVRSAPSDLSCTIEQLDDLGSQQLRIEGPHDLLRVAADAMDAPWTASP